MILERNNKDNANKDVKYKTIPYEKDDKVKKFCSSLKKLSDDISNGPSATRKIVNERFKTRNWNEYHYPCSSFSITNIQIDIDPSQLHRTSSCSLRGFRPLTK